MKYLLILLFLVGCSTSETQKEEIPKTPNKPLTDLRNEISTIIDNSPGCTKYRWKNRSVAPRAYINGISVMYAKQVCGQGTDFIKSNKITSTWDYYGKTYKHDDALEHYGIRGSALNTYTLLIGLGMRESSGRYGAGRDLSADYTSSSSAEAGLFQMAYVAKTFHDELLPLYEDFKSGKRSCELEAFKDSRTSVTKSHESRDYGTGEGAKWQNLMKKCPAFSTAWAAILVRARMAHFGPLKRKEAEFKEQCKEMLERVEGIAASNCESLK